MPSSPSFSSIDRDKIRTIFNECSVIIFVSNLHDQGETAAAAVAGTRYFQKFSKKIYGLLGDQKSLKHLNFLTSFPEPLPLTNETDLLASPLFSKPVIVALGITTPQDLPLAIQRLITIFPNLTLLNIDRQAHNTQYGTINLVDEKASATSELLYHLLAMFDPQSIDRDTATALLTGMIIATKSFRSGYVRPESLALASLLVECGAERETIIHHLYRNRSLSTLRLWGRALTRLKNNPSGLITTIITREDIILTGAEPAEIHGVADELLANAPEAKVTLLLYEDPAPDKIHVVHGLLSSEHHFSCLTLSEQLQGNGHERRVVFSMTFCDIETAEQHLTHDLTKRMSALTPHTLK